MTTTLELLSTLTMFFAMSDDDATDTDWDGDEELDEDMDEDLDGDMDEELDGDDEMDDMDDMDDMDMDLDEEGDDY